MVEPAGPQGGSGTDGAGGGDRSWSTDPMPTGPPQAADPGTAPTEPEILRPTEAWADPAPTTPYGHDASGYPAPGAPDPTVADGTYGGTAYPPAAYAPPAYGPSPYGAPAYPGYGSPYGPYAYGGYSPPTTNGLAVAAMVCGIVGLALCQVFAIPALFMGIIARGQINRSEGTQTGNGFALTGIITGAIALVIAVLLILFYLGAFAFMFTMG